MTRQAKLKENSANVSPMVRDASEGSDNRSNLSERPLACLKAIGPGPEPERRLYHSFLFIAEPGPASGPASRSKTVQTILCKPSRPPAYALSTHAQGPSHFCLRPSHFQQSRRTKAPQLHAPEVSPFQELLLAHLSAPPSTGSGRACPSPRLREAWRTPDHKGGCD